MNACPFISLDGIDGTGKSTQCRLLAEFFRSQGRTVLQCADPGGTATGAALRELLLNRRQQMTLACEAFLFMASRAQLVDEVIRPALEKGEVVICDRYLLANVVYQGHAGGLNPQQLWDMGELATGGVNPDFTIVLDLPVEKAIARRGRTADRIEARKQEFHERVRHGFLIEAKLRPEQIAVVDATATVEEVQEQIRQIVTSRLQVPYQ